MPQIPHILALNSHDCRLHLPFRPLTHSDRGRWLRYNPGSRTSQFTTLEPARGRQNGAPTKGDKTPTAKADFLHPSRILPPVQKLGVACPFAKFPALAWSGKPHVVTFTDRRIAVALH